MSALFNRREFLVASGGAALAATGSAVAASAVAVPATIIYNDKTIALTKTRLDGSDLWIPTAELSRVNEFHVKPQGACRADACFPLPKSLTDGGWINLTGFARQVKQSFVTDAGVWSFGEIPAVRGAFYTTRIAPDFAVPDRTGKIVRLSDFRGKKVLVFTWASWCLCRNDLKGWQTVYSELKDRKFEIVAVAEDTAGEAAAGKWYDVAGATYTSLVDPSHAVSTAFQFVNVPMGVWIDEHGKTVRPAEPAWTTDTTMKLGAVSVTTEGKAYVDALRDWVTKGDRSAYCLSDEEFAKRVRPRSQAEMEADASFKLAIYFHESGKDEAAGRWYKHAQALYPDDWNYFRQQWSFTPQQANIKWFQKLMKSTTPYYQKLDLPAAGAP